MGATGTVALGFDGLEVPDRDVVGVQTDDGVAAARPGRLGASPGRPSRHRRPRDPPAS